MNSRKEWYKDTITNKWLQEHNNDLPESRVNMRGLLIYEKDFSAIYGSHDAVSELLEPVQETYTPRREIQLKIGTLELEDLMELVGIKDAMHKKILRLYYQEGLNHREIEAELGVAFQFSSRKCRDFIRKVKQYFKIQEQEIT
jgi:hypothetical protein